MVPLEFRVGAGVAGFVIVIGICFAASFYYLTTTVRFEDRRLEAAVRGAIALPEGRITTTEAAKWVKLILPESGFQSLKGLERFVSLEEIDFSKNQVVDLSPLASLTALRRVTLNDNAVSDLNPLRQLYALESLSLDSNKIMDIEPISALPNLVILSLQYNIDLWNLAPGSPTVAMLGVRGCKIQNLQDIGGWPKLTWLEAGQNQLVSMSGIEKCPALSIVSLDGNRLKRIDVGAPSVTVLDLNQNAIERIDELPSFPALARLELSQNKIIKLPDISHLSSLKVLALDGNPLSSEICQGADYYRARGLEISTDTCPDLPPMPVTEQHAGGMPAWKRRQLEAIARDKARTMTPGFKSRVSTPADLQQHYDPSGRYSPPSREF
jgi:internalin A